MIRCGRRLSIWACPARRRSRWATRPSSGRSPTRARARERSGPPSRRSARAGVPTCRTRGTTACPSRRRSAPSNLTIHVTLAALDRGGELVRHLRVLADGLLLELEAHGDARRFVGRVERPREAGGLCCANLSYACTPSTRRFSLNARAEGLVGAAQRTASMPRGLAAAFIVFAFIVFLLVSRPPAASKLCAPCGATKTR